MGVTKKQMYYNWGNIDKFEGQNQTADKKISSIFGSVYDDMFSTHIIKQEILEPSSSHLLLVKKQSSNMYSCEYIRDIGYSSQTGFKIYQNYNSNDKPDVIANNPDLKDPLIITFKDIADAQYEMECSSPYISCYTENDIITVSDEIY
jgi:hypothetical protein